MYTQITFHNIQPDIKDILIAALQDDAEGFEEEAAHLKVIFLQDHFDEALVHQVAGTYHLSYEQNEIGEQNWNALWESNFDPVVVDDFVGIRAAFHQPVKNVRHEIIITPKMSFGTGHHATTYLMMKQMGKTDFSNKTVFDFGTGTGVLAILAKKLGAACTVASDIDEWSIENAGENFEKNRTPDIKLVHSGTVVTSEKFDIILANINRNVLLDNSFLLAAQLNKNGRLLLSGILEEDEKIVTASYTQNGLTQALKTQKEKWICLVFNKT
ncbi:MAG: 50S ribosomal protein L11 methyltransferase [Niabella sp.]